MELDPLDWSGVYVTDTENIPHASWKEMNAPSEQEAHAHLGATIQDNDRTPSIPWEWSESCCSIWHNCHEDWIGDGLTDLAISGPTQCQNDKHLMKAFGCRPNRCSKHGKIVKRFIRSKDWKKKLKLKFNRRRHLFVRLVTVGRPGIKHHDIDELEEIIAEYRKDIIANFNTLRKRAIWKNSVDGGMWFFENTIDIQDNGKVKVNPHLHIALLCSEKLPVQEINNYLAGVNGINLGRMWVSTPRNANGTIKKASIDDAVNYCINYIKLDQQIDGRNRGTFGTVYN
jgi:hypothetical protein